MSVAQFSVHGVLQARILEWVPFPSPRDLTDPGIEPGSPVLQADSLLSEPLGKPLGHKGSQQNNRKSMPTGSGCSKHGSGSEAPVCGTGPFPKGRVFIISAFQFIGQIF